MVGTVNIKKMHHRNAKETERAAAHKAAQTVKGRRLEALKALSSLAGGGTSDEIARSAGLSILSIRPRLTELQEMQLIVDSMARRTNSYGNSEIVWAITPEGKKHVR
jgi:hypothetical protein